MIELQGIAAINGGIETALLAAKGPLYEYNADGNKTSDTAIGTKFTVIRPGDHLGTMDVKILGADPLPDISDEEIQAQNRKGEFFWVSFTDFTCKLYSLQGSSKIGISATATGITVAGMSTAMRSEKS